MNNDVAFDLGPLHVTHQPMSESSVADRIRQLDLAEKEHSEPEPHSAPKPEESELPSLDNLLDELTQELQPEPSEAQPAAEQTQSDAEDAPAASTRRVPLVTKNTSKSEVSLDSFKSTQLTQLPLREHIRPAVEAGPSVDAPAAAASLLLAARHSGTSATFQNKDAAQKLAIVTGAESIRKTFADIRSTIGLMAPDEEIDWQFWGRVVDDYDGMVAAEPAELEAALAGGIPREFRGIVWQLVARSKSLQLEELYMHLKGEASAHERAIKRDLLRTSFFTNVDAASKADELFNVIKAYSIFDPDVGYTQGMAFIAVPLVMNMTEAEAFCMLVALMKEYGLRELYCPEMQGLHLLLHQYDRILEKNDPDLYNHMVRQGVRLLMYALQWFLTFFAYKFPLDAVLRIFDMVVTQGREAVLQLGVNLMLRNRAHLVGLQFDALVEFLKENLFDVYVEEQFHADRRMLILKRPKPSQFYRLDAFVRDAMEVHIQPSDLARYTRQFELMCERDEARVAEIEALRVKNGALRHEIKVLEQDFNGLNRDHLAVVQQLVDSKVLLPELHGDIEELEESIHSLQDKIAELEQKVDGHELSEDTDKRIQDLLQENAREAERFAALEEKHQALVAEKERLDGMAKKKKWFW